MPVRQIQEQTSLRLVLLKELLEELENTGVICRDDTRVGVAFCPSVADALEDSTDARLHAQIEKCSQLEVNSCLPRIPWQAAGSLPPLEEFAAPVQTRLAGTGRCVGEDPERGGNPNCAVAGDRTGSGR